VRAWARVAGFLISISGSVVITFFSVTRSAVGSGTSSVLTVLVTIYSAPDSKTYFSFCPLTAKQSADSQQKVDGQLIKPLIHEPGMCQRRAIE